MHIKGLETERFQDYKYPVMFIAFPKCSFKCDKECGQRVCQNSALASAPTQDIALDTIVREYVTNPITKAIVCGGLEPLDSFNELKTFIGFLRHSGCNDDVVIYTGYRKIEIADKIAELSKFPNIVMKFGRFKPGELPHYDNVLGTQLANAEQYGERIS